MRSVHVCETVLLAELYRANMSGCALLCCLKTFDTSPTTQVDDFAVAQSTPLPEYVAGVEGDEV